METNMTEVERTQWRKDRFFKNCPSKIWLYEEIDPRPCITYM